MPTPSSPPITMDDIVFEFGGPGELGAYLRGGAYVPNTPTNSGVPTSLPIEMAQLCGASATIPLSISLNKPSVSRIVTVPGGATTPTVTATATGGSGTKTYSWTRKSGDTGISATSSTSATTAFSGTVNVSTPIRDAVFTCTVTDASGSASADVSVHIEYSP